MPVLIAAVLLYQVLTDLHIAVFTGATLLIIAVVLGIAAVAGALAAFGPPIVRVIVLAAFTLLFIDVTFHLSGFFDGLAPAVRTRVNRDDQRIADVQKIKAALDQYAARYGALPMPADYGEGTGPVGYWESWWDLSSEDVNGDGKPFLDFLVDGGILPVVPIDPVNRSATKGDPRGGTHYVYYVVPPGYDYAGGVCDPKPNRWHYMVAIAGMEEKRPSSTPAESLCTCLWKDAPDFFRKDFDYVVCGTFDATKEAHDRMIKSLAQQQAAARAARAEAAVRAAEAAHESELLQYAPQDQRRVADLMKIRDGLQRYLREVGPLPAPRDYGESDKHNTGFWPGYWDFSSVDSDADGKPFLDFLVDAGIMPSVPVDPENIAPADGSPMDGRQYVYYVISPDDKYEGGSCVSGSKKWVYMLGITDLRSEELRPPKRIAGSGCSCLWKNTPGFFDKTFDYVICGTFDATPQSRARAAEILKQRAAAADAARLRAQLAQFVPQDRRRVADIQKIRLGLEQYIAKVGPLPAPRDYGEAENSKPGFWYHYWDVSSEDGDKDGKPFLDFLVDSGIMPSVPVDPENVRSPDGSPIGGRQYVYFVATPDDASEGGTCAAESKKSVYMLGITDLRSETTRPPTNFTGSGCECLWKNSPNYF
ncbi:MAG TPA: hypothetical protein VJZ00_21510, partial [Thermoanaerobaculia bacterium]|nr:hypothetical protein [Thermoanaerobaculia bacterium]